MITSCADCAYSKHDQHNVLRCHFYPPVVVDKGAGFTNSFFPTVTPDDFCAFGGQGFESPDLSDKRSK